KYSSNYDSDTHTFILEIDYIDVFSKLEVKFNDHTLMKQQRSWIDSIFELLNKAQIPFDLKDNLYQLMQQNENRMDLVVVLRNMGLDDDLFGAI
ncbi:hypothetical protein, partial [Alkalibacillus haloalkaliphilus]|uniref:hypothetical protein n=1 Tax=Alkalibacillus haloalkaliphilus TaxID=94136 RepID=UPI002936A305|nr:hypothetical protein [Alkalibacillus haloalkaliphilus]